MKTNFKIFTLFVLIALASCEKEVANSTNSTIPDCPSNQLPQQYRSLNLINPTASAGSIPVVATFKLSQSLLTYNNTSSCKNKTPNCAVSLIIKNTSERKVLFDYVVNFTSGTNSWQYEGFSSLNSSGVDSVGVISSNCGWISTANITITPGNISFQ